MSGGNNTPITTQQVARIAVYDDLLSAPRVVDVPPTDVGMYIEHIASKTYELSQARGGSIPYSVIREVAENLIHAYFKEPVISILDNGNTIRFADQGPGIENKDRAQLPGFTSATGEMKNYIRGVGSGFPLVKEYLRFSNGRLIIEDNIKTGTVITITVENHNAPHATPVVYQTQPAPSATPSTDQTAHATQARPIASKQEFQAAPNLDDRDLDILTLAAQMAVIGPTEVKNALGITVSTAYRILSKLEEAGLLETTSKRKKTLTDYGYHMLSKLSE